jgi:hypothetical protein
MDTSWAFPQDIESKPNLQPSVQVGDEESEQQNAIVTDEPLGDSCSLSCTGDDNKKVSREDIELVRKMPGFSVIFVGTMLVL